MFEKVGRDVQYSMGSIEDWSSVLAETSARYWNRHFWHVIFQRLYREAVSGSDLRNIRKELPGISSYFNGEDFIPLKKAMNDDNISAQAPKLREAVIEWLKSRKIFCYLVIDSLDEYPVLSPKFEKLIGGFLKSVNEFDDSKPNAKIICCLPEEIEPRVRIKSSNQTKDLTPDQSVSRLRWKPVDLLKVIANRWREFLYIHLNSDVDFISKVRSLDFSQRKDLGLFFSMVMPRKVVNRFGKAEDTLAYIVRHTHLLTRELIVIFNSAIKKSQEAIGSWRYIESDAIVAAIQDQEEILADQVLHPYQTTYPLLIERAPDIIANLSPIFSASDMDKYGGALRTSIKHETDDPWRTLFNIGVIGYIDEQVDGQESQIYEYARFHFNSASGITFANDRKYCIHPIFSGAWNVRRKNRDAGVKFIYPTEVDSNLWSN